MVADDRLGVFTENDARVVLDTTRAIRVGGVQLGGRNSQVSPLLPAIEFYNGTGETIPAYGAVQITGVTEFANNLDLLTAGKIDFDGDGDWLINSGRDVPDKGWGLAQPGPIYRLKGDGSTATLGSLWGFQEDDFEFADNGGPFICAGDDSRNTDVIFATLDKTPTYFARVTTELSAGSGTGVGSGVITVYRINGSDTAQVEQASIDCLNRFESAVAVDAEIVVTRVRFGRFMVIAEDCS